MQFLRHYNSEMNLNSVGASPATSTTNTLSTTTQVLTKSPTDDAFYDNLTLGLTKVLNSVSRITNVVCEKRLPCERAQLTTWEQRHNVYLPDDMKRFYLSTDGFNFTWCYQYSPNDVRRVGSIYFPLLIQISLVRDNIEALLTNNPPSTQLSATGTTLRASENHASQQNAPTLSSRSKLFELNNVIDLAKVCLVYESPEISNPKIYLLESGSLKWQFLADTFTEYLRMGIAHLGLPYWELCFSSCGLPSWAEQLYLLLAPHLLEKNDNRRNKTIQNCSEGPPYNILDPAVFRTKPRCSRQNQKR